MSEAGKGPFGKAMFGDKTGDKIGDTPMFGDKAGDKIRDTPMFGDKAGDNIGDTQLSCRHSPFFRKITK